MIRSNKQANKYSKLKNSQEQDQSNLFMKLKTNKRPKYGILNRNLMVQTSKITRN